eukprot:5955981-Pyramimonas_sp.AAC.1
MRCLECQDEYGLMVEVFKYASGAVLKLVLTMFNNILQKGAVDPSWHDMLFVMLPKKKNKETGANPETGDPSPSCGQRIRYSQSWYTKSSEGTLTQNSRQTK